MDAAHVQWDLAHRPDGTIDTGALLAWLRSQSVFDSAEAVPGGIEAHFTDGRGLAFMIRPPEGASGTSETRAKPDGVLRPQAVVPDGKTALVLKGLLCKATSSASERIAGYLNQQATYSATTQPASIANLRAVKDVSVLYFNTHGSASGLVTSDRPRPDLENDDLVRAELTAKPPLLYHTIVDDETNEKDGGCKSREGYSITAAFIKKHWHFKEDSLVYLSACQSATGALVSACADANASMVVGWSMSVASATAAQSDSYAFRRFLGIKDETGEAAFTPQRPWSWEQVLGGFGQKPADWAKPTFSLLKGDFGSLRPSVSYFEINEWEGTEGRIYLHGVFGKDLGQDSRITVGDIEIPRSDVVQWNDEVIQANLPVSAHGDVVVIARDKKSNRVPLTEWEVDMQYEDRPTDGIVKSAHCYLHIRGDVHGYRTRADEQPPKGKPPGDPSLFNYAYRRPTGIAVVHDSKSYCTFHAEGMLHQGCEVDSGDGTASQNAINFEAAADPDARELGMAFVMKPETGGPLQDGIGV